jgi:hypothetical protein
VRAVLALMIAGLFWTVLILAERNPAVEVPLFLYFLTGMVLLFFGSHGYTIGSHMNAGSPLHLPRGSIRFLLLVGAIGVFAWMYYKDPTRIQEIVTPKPEQLQQWPQLLLTTVGGYAVGYLIGRGPWRRTSSFQDLLAWVSLMAMIGLVVETVWIVFINPSLEVGMSLHTWEAALTAIVSFYFGARS